MDSASGKRSVAVRILDHDYRIRTEADEEAVGRVAGLVNDRMERIRTRTGTVDTLDLAVLAALNLANDLLTTGGTGEIEPSRDGAKRLRTLIDRVESVLREGQTA